VLWNGAVHGADVVFAATAAAHTKQLYSVAATSASCGMLVLALWVLWA
jgi:hypothetical protein